MPLPAPVPDKSLLTGKVTDVRIVLVVDDDSDTTDLLKVLLEPNSFTVFTANSGQGGVELAREIQPDVMVVDLLMPDMDGLKVCREVRKFCQAPILVLSAVDKPGIAAQALREGADDYLCKPIKRNVLIAYLNKLTRRSRIGRSSSGDNGRSPKF